jgi:hypothetical protein
MSAITRARHNRINYLNFFFEGNQLDDFRYFVQSSSNIGDRNIQSYIPIN